MDGLEQARSLIATQAKDFRKANGVADDYEIDHVVPIADLFAHWERETEYAGEDLRSGADGPLWGAARESWRGYHKTYAVLQAISPNENRRRGRRVDAFALWGGERLATTALDERELTHAELSAEWGVTDAEARALASVKVLKGELIGRLGYDGEMLYRRAVPSAASVRSQVFIDGFTDKGLKRATLTPAAVKGREIWRESRIREIESEGRARGGWGYPEWDGSWRESANNPENSVAKLSGGYRAVVMPGRDGGYGFLLFGGDSDYQDDDGVVDSEWGFFDESEAQSAAEEAAYRQY